MKGGKHDEAHFDVFFLPNIAAFFDTLIPHLVSNVTWDDKVPELPERMGINGDWVVQYLLHNASDLVRVDEHNSLGADRTCKDRITFMLETNSQWYGLIAPFVPSTPSATYTFPLSGVVIKDKSPSGKLIQLVQPEFQGYNHPHHPMPGTSTQFCYPPTFPPTGPSTPPLQTPVHPTPQPTAGPTHSRPFHHLA
ncbi:uncharacterized protein EI90DRAFT_3124985 [Cantharellus anzutake]|uniref:uncharacterized protein n=1 Tax=Cantharellus anzutake TaxID=1750568 RepID=UPI001902C765|nr:uncharacterized protein EI90DRAFT_3124985 [Cantharellus anzutake]KAF8329735.1 hypothetical protein EI90DRAFT_3124985 [Cantharellus anzutake]